MLALFLICLTCWRWQAVDSTIEPRREVPCVYEGHLKTKQSWFGFLANISIVNSARMTFEFVYPAHYCCQKVIFYSDDKISLVNHKLSCYQKMHLSKPEEDQLLRLTPKFPWSGCHLIHHKGQSYYICEGGRSFLVEKDNAKSGTWHLAVANCDTMHGLNLQYRLSVFGQVGECQAALFSRGLNPLAPQSFPLVKPLQRKYWANFAASRSVLSTCTYEGELNSTSNWHGFIANTSIAREGGFQFEFSYPVRMKTQNVILYNHNDIALLSESHSCWQKQGLIRSRDANEKILDLALHASWNGCVLKNHSNPDQAMIVCRGERRYNEPRSFFVAVSNCNSDAGLLLKYHLHVFAFNGPHCSHSPPNRPSQLFLILFFVSSLILVITLQA